MLKIGGEGARKNFTKWMVRVVMYGEPDPSNGFSDMKVICM